MRCWAATDGSIPACAGEPPATGGYGARTRVYPRVCGGTTPPSVLIRTGAGLSPRVRGNRKPYKAFVGRQGSIPACAGEPDYTTPPPPPTRVYPRVCGGTISRPYQSGARHGLSPRVRGNQPNIRPTRPRMGSIPACAGEPWSTPMLAAMSSVYPRVCGGTVLGAGDSAGDEGLSPRVRGNLILTGGAELPEGSIPACAGEPASQ